MALMSAYLVTTKNLDALFNSIVTAQAPEYFTAKFLKELDFTSSNDRLYIGVLKGLEFLEESGAPTQRYYEFLDPTKSKKVLAAAIRDAYEDLFRVNKKAHQMSYDEVKGKLKTLTQGKKSGNVLKWMTQTFKGLCEYADWSKEVTNDKKKPEKKPGEEKEKITDEVPPAISDEILKTNLHYNIQIHLPVTRDIAVYDAIFKSLRHHLF